MILLDAFLASAFTPLRSRHRETLKAQPFEVIREVLREAPESEWHEAPAGEPSIGPPVDETHSMHLVRAYYGLEGLVLAGQWIRESGGLLEAFWKKK